MKANTKPNSHHTLMKEKSGLFSTEFSPVSSEGSAPIASTNTPGDDEEGKKTATLTVLSQSPFTRLSEDKGDCPITANTDEGNHNSKTCSLTEASPDNVTSPISGCTITRGKDRKERSGSFKRWLKSLSPRKWSNKHKGKLSGTNIPMQILDNPLFYLDADEPEESIPDEEAGADSVTNGGGKDKRKARTQTRVTRADGVKGLGDEEDCIEDRLERRLYNIGYSNIIPSKMRKSPFPASEIETAACTSTSDPYGDHTCTTNDLQAYNLAEIQAGGGRLPAKAASFFDVMTDGEKAKDHINGESIHNKDTDKHPTINKATKCKGTNLPSTGVAAHS